MWVWGEWGLVVLRAPQRQSRGLLKAPPDCAAVAEPQGGKQWRLLEILCLLLGSGDPLFHG